MTRGGVPRRRACTPAAAAMYIHRVARMVDHVFSFTDCTSFALMRAMSLEEAFTFERGDFATAGLTTLV